MKDLVVEENGVVVSEKLSDSENQPINLSKPVEIDVKKERLIISLDKQVEAKADLIIKINYHKVADTRTSKTFDAAFVRYSYKRKPDAEKK